jgi:alanine-glyoxylate transaminase/serine-glyoxylate transaminase/serine-pyruvate transaminase
LAAHERADLRTGYWDWTARSQEGAHYLRYCGTPPVGHLYGLHEALDMIEEEGGLDAVWRRHAVLGRAVHAAVDVWSTPGGLELNILDPVARSNSVTTILTGSIDGDALRACASELGLTLGLGIGDYEGLAFRIGHMGHLNPPMLLGTLGTIEVVLAKLGARVGGSGVAAAAASIAAALGPAG